MLHAAALCLALLFAGAAAPPAYADPHRDLERARALVTQGEHSLARAYLDALVIHPRLTGTQRSNAYYYRGYSYFADGFHRSAAQDYMRALDYNTANVQAQMALAHLYANGQGVPRNPREAMRLALKAARSDYAPGALYVGHALLTGIGAEADVTRARYWLQMAADDGMPAALTQLGHSYRASHTDEPEPERAAHLYRQAISFGMDDALVALAYMHLNGEFEDGDREQAIALLEQGAGRDYAPALLALAGLYQTGAVGGEPDYVHAAELCSRAAALGHTPAFAQCAYLYGSNAIGDLERAHAYLRAGAERGDGFSQVALANLLLDAGGRDAIAEAQRWYRAAAARGDALAQNNLAWTLATSRHDDLRNAREAVAAAKAAVAQQPIPAYLDTMAAAYAEAGDFEQARAAQARALAALEDEDDELRAEFSERLARYEQRQPWRE